MSDPKDVAYRIALAEGFLAEAEQDFGLTRWRSCVDIEAEEIVVITFYPARRGRYET
jgi:hypothetical protein